MQIGWIGLAAAAMLTACSSKPAGEVEKETTMEKREATVSAESIRVEVWHDTVCPWCRIGLHNLEQVVSRWDGPPIEVVHRAYVFSPDLPPEGKDLRTTLSQQMSPQQIQAMFDRATQAGATYGIHFDYDKVRITPQTIPSHVLVDWAPAEKQGALLAGIHRAYFEEGRNIGDPEVLAEIVASVGLDPVAAKAALADSSRVVRVRQEAASAGRAGVRGVPHFVIGDRVLQGAQSPEALRQAIAAAAR